MVKYLNDAEMDELFDGVDAASAKFQSNYTREGDYLVVVTGCKPIQSRAGNKAVVVGLRAIKVLRTVDGTPAHSVGEDFTWYQQRNSGYESSFLSRIKTFIGTTVGEDPNAVSMGDCRAMTSDEQPMAGFVVETHQYKKDPSSKFVETEWRHLTEEDVRSALSAEEIERYLPEGIKNSPAA